MTVITFVFSTNSALLQGMLWWGMVGAEEQREWWEMRGVENIIFVILGAGTVNRRWGVIKTYRTRHVWDEWGRMVFCWTIIITIRYCVVSRVRKADTDQAMKEPDGISPFLPSFYYQNLLSSYSHQHKPSYSHIIINYSIRRSVWRRAVPRLHNITKYHRSHHTLSCVLPILLFPPSAGLH